jgi:hypothetical protein
MSVAVSPGVLRRRTRLAPAPLMGWPRERVLRILQDRRCVRCRRAEYSDRREPSAGDGCLSSTPGCSGVSHLGYRRARCARWQAARDLQLCLTRAIRALPTRPDSRCPTAVDTLTVTGSDLYQNPAPQAIPNEYLTQPDSAGASGAMILPGDSRLIGITSFKESIMRVAEIASSPNLSIPVTLSSREVGAGRTLSGLALVFLAFDTSIKVLRMPVAVEATRESRDGRLRRIVQPQRASTVLSCVRRSAPWPSRL